MAAQPGLFHLEKVPGSYVTEDFRHRADDIVWRVKVGVSGCICIC